MPTGCGESLSQLRFKGLHGASKASPHICNDHSIFHPASQTGSGRSKTNSQHPYTLYIQEEQQGISTSSPDTFEANQRFQKTLRIL